MLVNDHAYLTFLVLWGCCIIAAMIDVKRLIIPNVISYSLGAYGIVLTIGAACGLPVGLFGAQTWVQLGFGMFIAATLFCMALVLQKWNSDKEFLGGGDVKLLAAIGTILGAYTAFVIFIAALSGIAWYVLRREQRIAFAPHILVGVIITSVWGEKIVQFLLAH